MAVNTQSRSAGMQRFAAIFCAIVCVISIVNIFGSENRMIWIVVAAVAAIGALIMARSFAVFQRQEY